MWNRNSDTGKWSNRTDTLSIDNYNNLKQDLQSVKLFSKCLSGSTYLPINSLSDIYDVLSIDKIGFYISDGYANSNIPQNGPRISLDQSNSSEFYNKYLREDAFTLKNLFTPTKLINDQLNNYVEVDVVTSGTVSNIGQPQIGLVIDGVKLIDGHRILIKDQISVVTLPSSTDPEYYFTNILPVSNYFISDNMVTDIKYYYYNHENGVYLYKNHMLIRDYDLMTYSESYKYSIVPKLGNTNRDKQFHLLRLKNGYFPLVSESQNIEFSEKNNWILRNRLDYHNIFDINYYDILHHDTQLIYDINSGLTYSIPNRTICVGDFGVIINNQDTLTDNATFSTSHIINNKYKSNLKSISEVDKYYWICGDGGTLLCVSKIDFSIRKFDLNENSNLTSISFYNNLYGVVVGKFNTIYFTNNGGDTWNKIDYPEFELYSYNKVIQYDFNQIYVGGESGVFIEFTYSNGTWIAYKRIVSKKINTLDEYLLVEDINDMYKTSWNTMYAATSSSIDSPDVYNTNIIYTANIIDGYNTLEISVNSDLFGNTSYNGSEYYITFSMSNSSVSLYTNTLYGPQFNTSTLSDIWNDGITYSNNFTISLPIDNIGNLLNDTYTIDVYSTINNNNITIGYFTSSLSFDLQTRNGRMILISTNNDNIICYDIDHVVSNNDFIYYGFSQSHSDIQTITRLSATTSVYIGGDQIYKFHINDFLNLENTSSNLASSISYPIDNTYVNKIYQTDDKIFISGNHSMLEFTDYISTTFSVLDPNFNSRIKSKMLFLDYDIASKLNFFNSDYEYVLPNSATFSDTFNIISIGTYSNQHNWLSYYKDSIKTFTYFTSMQDSNVVEFSSTFTFNQSSSFTFSSSQLSIDNTILPFAPSVSSLTQSIFISYGTITATNSTPSYDVMMNKSIVIFKRPITDVYFIGDVLYLSSNIIDCNLIINKILNIGLYKYLYCYSDFNQNILNSLKLNNGIVTVDNLNRFSNINDMISKIKLHPVGIGYSITHSNGYITVNSIFNNMTAYYNMQSLVSTNIESNSMLYVSSFLNFGYSPTYNIMDYLSMIDGTFIGTKKISILPEYINLPGNNGNSFTHSNIYIDPTVGIVGNTSSYYRNGTNQLIFGADYRFHWESLLLNTFVDINAYGSNNTYNLNRLLITNKYYNSSIDGYVIEFHKKIDVSGTDSILRFDILSRNTLQHISDDLQLLNNIQKTKSTKSIQNGLTFDSLENELKYKFSTDSYFKALASDYDIRNYLSGIIYTDLNSQISLNILNLEKNISYDVSSMLTTTGTSTYGYYSNKLLLYLSVNHSLKIGDLVFLDFGTASQTTNIDYYGLQTVIDTNTNSITLSIDFSNVVYPQNPIVRFIKSDPFLNYQPIDIFNLGVDKNVTRSVGVYPENISINGSKYNLVNLDLNKYKFQFVDGLSLYEINTTFPWILESEISNAIIGRDDNGPIWYSGTWICGRWFGGTWISGTWLGGDWYGGTWSAYNTTYKIISDQINTTYVDNSISKWYGGRWFDGTWNGGTWYDGRRYSGDWNRGIWYNGIWNDGHWYDGDFEGGIWVSGTWESGTFNCNSKPAYWINGIFNSGDFENGMWYNGQFGNIQNKLSRFGTKSTNTRNSTWHGGNWIGGEFHSQLNIDSQSGLPIVSDIHKYSIWKTGNWIGGDFYGGISYDINFKKGTWHGGILEEIQIIGISTSINTIQLNGIFRFNIGDEIWIIDDYTNTNYSIIGSNDIPMKYTIVNCITDIPNKTTYLQLNYELSSINITSTNYTETGLRIVSYFKDSHWMSGIWTNGIFDGGRFDSGIWYNGVLVSGNWGN